MHYSKKLKNTRVVKMNIWNVFFEGVIFLIFDLWLLISVAAALNLHDCCWLFLRFLFVFDFTVIKLLLLIFISIYKAVWPNHQDKRLPAYGTSKDVGSKPTRDGWTLASKRGTYKYNLLSISLLVISRLGMWAEAHV